MQPLFWVLLVLFCFAVNARTLMKKLSFDSCKQDSWRVSDISFDPIEGGKINVVADVGYEEKPTKHLHQIKLTLLGCGENFKCANHTDLVVGDVHCENNKDLTEMDKEACDVAKTLAEWEQDNGGLRSSKLQSSGKKPTDVCIHYDTKQVNANVAT